MDSDRIKIKACTSLLKGFLSEYADRYNNKALLQNQAFSNPFCFECVLDDLSSSHGAVLYWAAYGFNRSVNFNSEIIKEVFRFVETAPLLCILDDFIEPLDEFFSKECGTKSSGSDSDSDSDSESKKEVASKSDSPTCNNSEYVRCLEFSCLLKTRSLLMKHHWHAVVEQSMPQKWKDFVDVHRSLLLEKLDELISKVDALIVKKFGGVDCCKPRFLQLCEKLELTEKERLAMTYIFIQNAGVLFGELVNRFSTVPKGSGVGANQASRMSQAAAMFAGMNGREKYEFFSENRLHLKQELFCAEDKLSSVLSSVFLWMSPIVVKACCGGVLSAEETYKIDKTVLAEVLSAEKSGAATGGTESKDDTAAADQS